MPQCQGNAGARDCRAEGELNGMNELPKRQGDLIFKFCHGSQLAFSSRRGERETPLSLIAFLYRR